MSQETERFGPEPLIGEGSIRIKSPALKAIEKSLLQNFNDLGALLMMPRLMVTFNGIVNNMLMISTRHVVHAAVEKQEAQQAIFAFLDEIVEYGKDHEGFGKLWSKSEEEVCRAVGSCCGSSSDPRG